jgi:hypothetical protein
MDSVFSWRHRPVSNKKIDEWLKDSNFDRKNLEKDFAIAEWVRDFRISECRTQYFQKLGKKIIARLVGLWARLRAEEQEQYDASLKAIDDPQRQGCDVFFLSSRIVEQGLEPWFLTILDPEGILLRYNEASLGDEASKREFMDAQEKAKKMLAEILESESPTHKDHPARMTIERLLDELWKTHKRTRYRPNDEGDLTVQAKLAHMEVCAWRNHVVRRIAWRHVHLPLAVNALIRLAEMRFWMAPHEPIEFHYDADNRLLRPASKDQFARQVNTLGRCGPLLLDRPVWALATYHHEDRFVRLRFLPEGAAHNRVRIEIEYEIPGQCAADPHFDALKHKAARSKGMVARIADTVFRARGNILRVTNSIGTFDPHTGDEVGKLRLAVEFESPTWSKQDSEKLRDAVDHAVNATVNNQNDHDPGMTAAGKGGNGAGNALEARAPCRVAVIPFKRECIFISSVFSHGRFRDFQRILDKVAARHGLETRYAKTNTEEVRRNVHQQIAECRYFLQIITPRAEDQIRMRTHADFVPDFTWVTYEHGCALALQQSDPGRRCVQMIDTLMSDFVRARLDRTRGDIAPIDFRLDDSARTLRRRFQSAIVAFLRDP